MYSEGPSCGTCKYFLLRAHNEYPCNECDNLSNNWTPKEEEKPKQIWNCRTHEWEDEE